MSKKDCEFREPARAALRALSTPALLRGMRAFSHAPRGQFRECDEDVGCFVYEALHYRDHESLMRNKGAYSLSHCYEFRACCSNHKLNDHAWLYGECLRELAERGVTPEPQVAVEGVSV